MSRSSADVPVRWQRRVDVGEGRLEVAAHEGPNVGPVVERLGIAPPRQCHRRLGVVERRIGLPQDHVCQGPHAAGLRERRGQRDRLVGIGDGAARIAVLDAEHGPPAEQATLAVGVVGAPADGAAEVADRGRHVAPPLVDDGLLERPDHH
ncbi:MAG: hypothetical protein ACKO6E_11630, partial [Planctomycetota bacterium]